MILFRFCITKDPINIAKLCLIYFVDDNFYKDVGITKGSYAAFSLIVYRLALSVSLLVRRNGKRNLYKLRKGKLSQSAPSLCKACSLTDVSNCKGCVLANYFTKPEDKERLNTLVQHYGHEILQSKLHLMESTQGSNFVKLFIDEMQSIREYKLSCQHLEVSKEALKHTILCLENKLRLKEDELAKSERANEKLFEYIRQNCNEISSLADDPSIKDLFDKAYSEDSKLLDVVEATAFPLAPECVNQVFNDYGYVESSAGPSALAAGPSALAADPSALAAGPSALAADPSGAGPSALAAGPSALAADPSGAGPSALAAVPAVGPLALVGPHQWLGHGPRTPRRPRVDVAVEVEAWDDDTDEDGDDPDYNPE